MKSNNQYEETLKYLKKQIKKAMFSRWERIKLWFLGIKI